MPRALTGLTTENFNEKWPTTLNLFVTDFLLRVKITSKEGANGPEPFVPYEAQMMFLDKLLEGLQKDCHFFCCLKARQLGISTVLLALDLYWLFVFKGLQGAFIADTGENKEIFRDSITEILENLPESFKSGVKRHNRNSLTLNNGSRLQYMSAGKGKNSGLGRSRGLNFVHATECSSWGDQKGLESLIAALAQENPNRLYVFESTALGYNLWFDMYKSAKEDNTTQCALFIGWWAKDIYRFKRGSAQFKRYWDDAQPFMSEYEAEKTAEVLRDFNHEIGEEQWAWYRWMASNQGETSMLEEYPTTPDEAFQATGSSFFNLKKINEDMALIHAIGEKLSFNGYRYEMADLFTSMRVKKVTSIDEADLRVWEEPNPRGKYVIGVDPAYGRSEEADRSVISVWRCYADRLVQVAEYASPWPETRQVAWVLAHLAGCYQDCMINLEVSGPGHSVFAELKYLKQQIMFGQLRKPAAAMNIANALDTARWFLYHRPDSMGAGYAYNWKTGWDTKMLLFNRFRDAYNTDQLTIRSVPALEEMLTLVQDGDSIAASGRNKDDRAFAAGLACYAWGEWIRAGMMVQNRTFEREQAMDQQRIETKTSDTPVTDTMVERFFNRQAKDRQQAQLDALIRGY